nr:MAG TPA: ADP-ribosyltransferase [Caudoviricetes sp.]
MTKEAKVVEQRIVQRFIKTIADYEEGGEFYSQVIPLNTQAFAIYDSQEKSGLYYVLGDGSHTYVEIREGQSSLESSHEYAVFSDAWIALINSKADLQYMNYELTKRQLISNLVTEITEENEKSTTLYPSNKAVSTLADILQDNLDQEITDRHNADNDLQDTISQEEAKRIEKDTELTQDISKEITARQNADSALNVSIEEESSRAINKEDQIIADYTAADSTLSININTLREDLAAEKTRAINAEENLDNIKANKADVYTKTEIDGKLTAVMHFKGTKETYDDLPDSGSVGDVWNILDSGVNYAWDGEKWDKLSETLDLSPYALNTDVDSKILTEKDKRENADNVLSQAIDTEKTRAETAENSLQETKANKSELPTKTSELTNDSDFTTNAALQEQVTALTQQIEDLKLLIPTEVFDVATAKTVLNKAGKVTLYSNIDLGTYAIVNEMFASNNTTINLNDYEIKCAPSSGLSIFMLRGSANYTFNGNGRVIDTANDSSCIWTTTEYNICTINDGTWTSQHTECIYCEKGIITINGGEFKTENSDKRYLLNCKDANYQAGTAKIIVKGGKFWDFDPHDNLAEGEHTNFCATGYTTTSEEIDGHIIYTVIKA